MKWKLVLGCILLTYLSTAQSLEEKPRVSVFCLQADYGFFNVNNGPLEKNDILSGSSFNFQVGRLLKLQIAGTFVTMNDSASSQVFNLPGLGLVFEHPHKSNDFFMQTELMFHNLNTSEFTTSIGARLGKTITKNKDGTKSNIHFGSRYYQSADGNISKGMFNFFIGLGIWIY
jgi:hypothetical protein